LQVRVSSLWHDAVDGTAEDAGVRRVVMVFCAIDMSMKKLKPEERGCEET
jgi:hypothetical protein